MQHVGRGDRGVASQWFDHHISMPWHEKEAKMWASIDKQQIFEWVEVKSLTSDHSFAKRLFEKVSIDFQMLKRAANAR